MFTTGWTSLLVVLLWLIGRIVTDRFGWSQWLWWIPTPLAICAGIVALLASFRKAKNASRRRWRIRRWCIGVFAIVIYFGAVEHRMWRGSPDIRGDGTISIAHWNCTTPPGTLTAEVVTSRLIAMDADITVLTGDARLLHDEAVINSLARGGSPVGFGTVSMVSRFPVVSIQTLVATQGAFISAVTLDATESLGRSIVVYMVDMPSDPHIGRMQLAKQIRALLDGLNASDAPPPPADIVVGDFNIPRGSASLSVLFPGLSHAFAKAGHGYGATFHREWYFPLYHIDHTLVAPSMLAVRYDVVDTGVSRHCAQKAWIEIK